MHFVQVADKSYEFWQKQYTVMILIFRTDMPVQTVQTQIRLLLEEKVI